MYIFVSLKNSLSLYPQSPAKYLEYKKYKEELDKCYQINKYTDY